MYSYLAIIPRVIFKYHEPRSGWWYLKIFEILRAGVIAKKYYVQVVLLFVYERSREIFLNFFLWLKKTNPGVYVSRNLLTSMEETQVKYQTGSRWDPANPTWDPRWEWWDPTYGSGIPPFPSGMKILSHPGSRIKCGISASHLICTSHTGSYPTWDVRWELCIPPGILVGYPIWNPLSHLAAYSHS